MPGDVELAIAVEQAGFLQKIVGPDAHGKRNIVIAGFFDAVVQFRQQFAERLAEIDDAHHGAAGAWRVVDALQRGAAIPQGCDGGTVGIQVKRDDSRLLMMRRPPRLAEHQPARGLVDGSQFLDGKLVAILID